MSGFWEFIGSYWWLLLIFGGPIGAGIAGISKSWSKASVKRAELRTERYRIKHGYQQGHQLQAADAQAARVAFVAATQRAMDAEDAVTKRWLGYELDAVQVLEYPLMTDMREPVTIAFHRAKRRAEALRPSAAQDVHDRDTQREYRDAVTAYASAFDIAEAEARRVRQAGFSTDERDRLATAMKLLNLALDEAATPAERQSAYQRVRKEIDGLIVLPAATHERMSRAVAAELPMAPEQPQA